MTEFEEVYNQYFKDIYLYVKALSGSDSIAEEITSDTFFKAMNAIEHFRGECNIRVWLCQIAKNSYYSYLKKQKKYIPIDELQEVSDKKQSVEEILVDKEETARIHRILHKLEEPYKEVFNLRVFGELSFDQIATIFGKSENWACVTYHRARKKMKERMEGTS